MGYILKFKTAPSKEFNFFQWITICFLNGFEYREIPYVFLEYFLSHDNIMISVRYGLIGCVSSTYSVSTYSNIPYDAVIRRDGLSGKPLSGIFEKPGLNLDEFFLMATPTRQKSLYKRKNLSSRNAAKF